MTNPVIDNIRRSLGRTAQTPIGLRPAIYASRQAESLEFETKRFLDEIKKLSAVGEQLSPREIETATNKLVTEQNIRKATVWETPSLRQLGMAEILNSLGVELVARTQTNTRWHNAISVSQKRTFFYLKPER